MRQVANDISTQSNSLETALGEGILEWKRHRKSIYQSNDNAAVEVSPAMENLRIERALHISSTSTEEKEDEEVIIFVCTLCYSKHSSLAWIEQIHSF